MLGLDDRITCERSPVGPARLNEELMVDNPLNKIPTLICDDGLALYDSRVICEYLDSLAGGGILFPAEGPERWQSLAWQCLADGLVDVAILRRDEHYRGDGHRSPAHFHAYSTKMGAALDAMEASVPGYQRNGVTIGTIATGVALAYLDFRPPGKEWRDGRPALSEWEAEFAGHPAMLTAPFPDEGGTPKQFPVYKIE
jgi:glutathione S-transferase